MKRIVINYQKNQNFMGWIPETVSAPARDARLFVNVLVEHAKAGLIKDIKVSRSRSMV